MRRSDIYDAVWFDIEIKKWKRLCGYIVWKYNKIAKYFRNKFRGESK